MKEYFKKVKDKLNKKKDNKKKGFTLIELLAVIVILAIVLVVTIPNVLNSMKSAKKKQADNAIKIIEDYMNSQYELCKSGLGEFTDDYNKKLFNDDCTLAEDVTSEDILEAAGIPTDVISRISDYRFDNGKFTIGSTEYGDAIEKTNDNLLKKRIENLFFKSNDIQKVTNNSITYYYANIYGVNGGVMNDRKGGSTNIGSGNIRYYGKNPNNYIYFNCTDYSNQTGTTCEKWRIIGIVDGKVKIIRNDSIGSYSWDTSASGINSGYGINQWGESSDYQGSDLMKLLNPGYESNKKDGTTTLVNNSLYWNRQSGTCFSGSSNATKSCGDFTTSGITNTTKGLISDATWYLGGTKFDYYNAYANDAYLLERGLSVGGYTVIQNPNDSVVRTTTWAGKVGLMYVSDYAYAANLSGCTQTLNQYDNCCDNNWLCKDTTNNYRTLGIQSDKNTSGYQIWWINKGHLSNYQASSAGEILPTVYLKESAVISDAGDGSEDNPYKLLVG